MKKYIKFLIFASFVLVGFVLLALQSKVMGNTLTLQVNADEYESEAYHKINLYLKELEVSQISVESDSGSGYQSYLEYSLDSDVLYVKANQELTIKITITINLTNPEYTNFSSYYQSLNSNLTIDKIDTNSIQIIIKNGTTSKINQNLLLYGRANNYLISYACLLEDNLLFNGLEYNNCLINADSKLIGYNEQLSNDLLSAKNIIEKDDCFYILNGFVVLNTNNGEYIQLKSHNNINGYQSLVGSNSLNLSLNNDIVLDDVIIANCYGTYNINNTQVNTIVIAAQYIKCSRIDIRGNDSYNYYSINVSNNSNVFYDGYYYVGLNNSYTLNFTRQEFYSELKNINNIDCLLNQDGSYSVQLFATQKNIQFDYEVQKSKYKADIYAYDEEADLLIDDDLLQVYINDELTSLTNAYLTKGDAIKVVVKDLIGYNLLGYQYNNGGAVFVLNTQQTEYQAVFEPILESNNYNLSIVVKLEKLYKVNLKSDGNVNANLYYISDGIKTNINENDFLRYKTKVYINFNLTDAVSSVKIIVNGEQINQNSFMLVQDSVVNIVSIKNIKSIQVTNQTKDTKSQLTVSNKDVTIGDSFVITVSTNYGYNIKNWQVNNKSAEQFVEYINNTYGKNCASYNKDNACVIININSVELLEYLSQNGITSHVDTSLEFTLTISIIISSILIVVFIVLVITILIKKSKIKNL